MPDHDNLRPADPEDLAECLAFALKFNGRKRVSDADVFMARMVDVARSARSLAIARRRRSYISGRCDGRWRG
jgi:hypothetical protein